MRVYGSQRRSQPSRVFRVFVFVLSFSLSSGYTDTHTHNVPLWRRLLDFVCAAEHARNASSRALPLLVRVRKYELNKICESIETIKYICAQLNEFIPKVEDANTYWRISRSKLKPCIFICLIFRKDLLERNSQRPPLPILVYFHLQTV